MNNSSLLKNLRENLSFAEYTAFRIGGPARYFCSAKSSEEVVEALDFARSNNLEIFVLGGGSKVLVSDKGFGGLVVKLQSSDYKLEDSKIIAQAGVPLALLINECTKNNLTGLEWAAGIPAITLGGAIHNNAGAYGKSMSDLVEEVDVIDLKAEKIATEKLSNKECQFSYRSSIFRETKKYIILGAVLKLDKGSQGESKKMILEYLKARKEKQPMEFPSAGSIFKNPFVEEKHLLKLEKEYPELKHIAKNNIIPAAWFIEAWGLKGKKIGGAMVSDKHANFIVNTGNAKAEDVVILISLIKQKIRVHFGVQLMEEIEYVGF